jgi:hypothetical protein
MIKFKIEKIEEFKVTFYVTEDGKFYAETLHFGTGLPVDSFEYCRKIITDKINAFKSTTPTSYKELASSLTASLTWTGYEECELEETTVEVIVGNFIKYLSEKK